MTRVGQGTWGSAVCGGSSLPDAGHDKQPVAVDLEHIGQ